MDLQDYLIRAVYEDMTIQPGKTYHYKIERMIPGEDSHMVGSTSAQVPESIEEKKADKTTQGIELLQPVTIEHQGKEK
ncbi:MAG: hypothetical protein HYR80_10830 [Nitrospirae bacterium]|nr:hypothetical protein [Nitrospirota bacterium]